MLLTCQCYNNISSKYIYIYFLLCVQLITIFIHSPYYYRPCYSFINYHPIIIVFFSNPAQLRVLVLLGCNHPYLILNLPPTGSDFAIFGGIV